MAGGTDASAGTVSDNIYISELPPGIDEETVRTMFSAFGTVTQLKVIPPNAMGGKSVALVRFDSVDAATWVVGAMNGQIPPGLSQPIAVRYADPPRTAAHKGGRPSPYGAVTGKGGGPEKDNIYVKNLPLGLAEDGVKAIFGQYGTVLRVKVIEHKHQGSCAALVQYATAEDGEWVVSNLNGNIPEGCTSPVDIKFYEPAARPGMGKGDDKGKGKGYDKGGPAHAAVGNGFGGWGEDKGGGKGGGKGKSSFSMKTVVDGFEKSGSLPGAPRNGASLYVGGLPPDAEDIDLFRLFTPFGPIAPSGCKVVCQPHGGCKGFGFVNFQDPSAAEEAIKTYHGTSMPDGSTFVVKVKA